jgi:hypothetical protein
MLAPLELQMGLGLKIDNIIIKGLSIGGNTFCGRRRNHREDMQFKMKGVAWAFANNISDIVISRIDDAIQNRVAFIDMTECYLVGEKRDCCK